MLAPALLIALLFQTAPVATQAPPKAATTKTVASAPANAPSKDQATDPDELAKLKRIYVDSFGDDVISKEMQSMIVSALVNTKRFIVTENRDRADAILKGVALEKTSQEVHAYNESTAVGGAAGGHHGEISGSVINGNGSISGSSAGGFVAHHEGISDSSLNTETIDNARVAIRLVNRDGDVIWTTTQESKGAKYKGSSADVADKCVKQLMRDVAKLEAKDKPTNSSESANPAARNKGDNQE